MTFSMFRISLGNCSCADLYGLAKVVVWKRTFYHFRRRHMLKEFKEFAMKGNVVDLAIGVIIGGAFGKIIDSLVNDIIMPIVANDHW